MVYFDVSAEMEQMEELKILLWAVFLVEALLQHWIIFALTVISTLSVSDLLTIN